MNIIVLVIDTLRYDYISFHGKNHSIQTPNFNRLAEKSWVFDRAFAASYPTFPHRTDVITGRYGDPFNPWLPLRCDLPTLPHILARAGYCTQLIHDTPVLVNGGASFDYPFHAWTQIDGASTTRPWIDDKPFEFLDNWELDPLFDFMGDREMKEVWGHQLVTYTRANRFRKRPEDWNVARLFLKASDFLKDNAKRTNFFLWIDCFDPHEPWDAPPEFMRLYDKTPGYNGSLDPRLFDYMWRQNSKNEPLHLPPEGFQRLKASYAAKVSLVDRWFGDLLDTLEETGLADNTALILTADHGTCLGENNRFSKRVFWEVGEPEGHVPLIVSMPGGGAGRWSGMIQPQDIFSAVLGIAGLVPPDSTSGYNFLKHSMESVPPSRDLALMGYALHAWTNDPGKCFFTVFTPEWCLNCAAAPNSCRLFRYGSDEDVAAMNVSMVREIRLAGIEEIGRRGAPQSLIDWYRSEGRTPFPEATWPGPPGWTAYWDRLYNRWE